MKLDDGEMQAWWAKAEVSWHAGHSKEAFEHLATALARRPDSVELWTLKAQWLEKERLDQEALTAYDKAVVLTQFARDSKAAPSSTTASRKSLLLARANLSRHLGRDEAARADRLEALGIPSRDPSATREQIDLGLHYDAALTDSWHGGGPGHDLASLPSGVHTLGGVRWDVRGFIQVGCESGEGEPYPKRVDGIPVESTCQRIHFLHAAICAAGLNEAQIGRYVAHFADGREIEIPIVVGRDLANWWNQLDDASKPFVIAWTGTSAHSAAQGRTTRLFKTTWVNPLPEVALQSIDFVSTHERAAPFVVAITAETNLTQKILPQPQPQAHLK